MANKIDTGTGGFPTGDLPDLTTYDVGVVQDSPPSPAVPWSAGDIKAQGEQGSSDISKSTVSTLADYLSTLTLKNVYSVDSHVVDVPLTKLVDGKGFPLSATDSQANPANKSHFTDSLQSSYTADLIAASAAPIDPLKIKRGLAPGGDPDGNTLLSTAAFSSLGVIELTSPLKTYNAELLKHNIESKPNVVIGDGGLVHSDKIRPLAHTTTLSVDAGTSKNILHPDKDHKLSLKDTIDLLKADTKKNVYPVDGAKAGDLLIKLVDPEGFPVSATTGQANPANTSRFAGNLQSSYTKALGEAIDKKSPDVPFKIKRGLAIGDDPDGNKLLLNATTAAGAISPNFKTYTAEILKPNLNNPLDANLTNVIVGDGGNISAANIRPILHTTTFSDDGGTSKNILHPDAAHHLFLKDSIDHLEADTKKNVYSVDGAKAGDPLVKLVDGKGFPVSATEAQANPANTSHFTDALKSSYTADLIAAGAAQTDPFKIKRGLASGTAPDGNKLLSTAAFSSAEGVINLTAPLKTYNEELLKHNIKSQPNVVIGDGGLVHADMIRELSHTTTFSADGGTSKNILHPDAENNLSLKDTVDHLEADTKKNYYPVFQNALAADTSFKLSTPDGYPSQIIPTRNEKKFVDTANDQPRSTLSTVSDKYSNVDNFLKGKGTKLAPSGDEKNGNTLLRSIGENLQNIDSDKKTGFINEAHPVAKYSKALLNSRFNIDNSYEKFSIADTNSTFYAPQFAQKYPLGRSLDETEPRNITFGKLAQLGPALSLRSGLEMTDLANPTGGVSEAEALLPGVSQTGIERIERSRLEAGNVLTELLQNGLEDADPKSVIINPAALSYGSLNNIFDQYSGISNFGMQILAIALILALSIIMVAVFGLFSIMSKNRSIAEMGSQNIDGYDSIGRRTIGSYLGRGSSNDMGSVVGIIRAITAGQFNFWQVIGIQPTRNELQDCAVVGALAFFGIDFTNDLFGKPSASASILNSLAAGAQNPGYDSIMARSVSRSFLSISDALIGFKGTTATGGIKKTLGLIEVLRDSKFMSALNIFSQLGDQVLSGAYDTFVDTTATGGFGKKISEMDKKPDDSKSSHEKNRLKGIKGEGTNKLAWASYRAPDMLIWPKGLTEAQKLGKLDEPRGFVYAANHSDVLANLLKSKEGNKDYSNAVDARISTELREALEVQLDAEYMPFYFHDVRTNEIISFHAFLSTLNDAYTATYDSVDAFGRVEQIKTYKGTQRKINLSFHIAALDAEDFDYMWSKINKLVTMVYPQFTEGKSISSDGYKITAPFSQLIGAPPMTRLRIGDLIQSNYSKFNLARLFGYTYPGNIINGVQIPSDAVEIKQEVEDSIKKYIERAKTVPSKERFYSNPPRINKQPEGIIYKIDGDHPDADIYTVVTPEVDPDAHLFEKDAAKKFLDDKNFKELKLVTLKSDLFPTLKTLNTIHKDEYSKAAPSPPTDYYTKVSDFMNDKVSNKGNIIAKSFRSSGGRGIAGFIETMTFDWHDKVTWAGFGDDATSTSGGARRAPKICKVTLAFSPIHDITPGLDHMGANRAPVYPVGYLSPKQRR